MCMGSIHCFRITRPYSIDQKYFEVTYSSLIYTTLPDSRCQKIQKESVSVLFESLLNL